MTTRRCPPPSKAPSIYEDALKNCWACWGIFAKAAASLPRVLVADWRDRVRRERGVDASDARALDTSRQAFQRAVDALKRARLVGVYESRAWLW